MYAGGEDYKIRMCLGPAVEPATEKAKTYVTIIRVLLVVQAVVVILNFVAANAFLREAIFGIFFFFILYIIQHQVSYQVIMVYIFISIFFAITFMVYFLTPLQKGDQFDNYTAMQKFYYADSVISFLYYAFSMVFCFFPYREFKAIAYNENPALRTYFENQNQGSAPAPDDPNNLKKADYDIDYGNIAYDQQRRNNDNGTFEVFKGKGVRIG